MRILLTGVTGFIGQYVARRFVASHDVYGIYRANKLEIPGIKGIKVDFTEDDGLINLPDKIDVVIHLAQSRFHHDFPDQAMDIFNVNVASTMKLLDYSRRAYANYFLLASSGVVYEPFENPIEENQPIRPLSMYGISKAMAENLTLPYSDIFKTCSLRLFFPYGPGQRDRLMATLIKRIASKQPVKLPGEKKQGAYITPTYIEDIVNVIEHAVNEQWQGIFNVASPEKITIREISDYIGKLVGKSPCYEYFPNERALNLVPNLERLAEVYPLHNFCTLETGLRNMLENNI